MAFSLFQWIGLGFVVALVLIPTVRWFWKRFDMPSKFALEAFRIRKQEAEEAEMWAGIEAQIKLEEDKMQEIEIKRKERDLAASKSLTDDQSAMVWNKLGIDVPIQPVEREKTSQLEQQISPIELTMENALDIKSPPQEPDWELIEKMSNLDKPTEGVPEAPDLGPVEN